VIAFTARTLETGEKAGAKYINSPETPLYSKGHVLFNLDKAKPAIRAMEFALLVEGQMDCISVFMCGIKNVIATSGTAFTEQQVAILKRHTSNVVVSFDPDGAGANATEKTINLLVEEGFKVRIVSKAFRDSKLDPDRFVREVGVESYAEATQKGKERADTSPNTTREWDDYAVAIRGAQWHADYLIERARLQFPGSTPDQRIKAMNFLLPHIRRIPEMLAREQFAVDAAQKLGIASAVLREELKLAALRRRDRVEERAAKLNEVEKVLLRALAVTNPEGAEARLLAAEALTISAAWFEHLGAFGAMRALAGRAAKDPMDAVEDPSQKALLAEALLGESGPPNVNEVESAVQEVQERAMEGQLRELRGQIAEAERNGDNAGLALLTQTKLELDRALRRLHGQKAGER
jgi:DNA primase